MRVCSRLQSVLLNQKDMCWLLTSPTYPHSKVAKQDEDYWLKAAVFTGKCQEVSMAVAFAFHAGKAVVQIAALEIAITCST